MTSGTRSPATLRRFADAGLALLVVLIVGMMIVPLPTPLLDVLLASNIALAIIVLLVAMYVPDGLAFTSFPTILLVTTLFRLALNVSSTRLILLQADAGEVIRAFGHFVVQGNYVVGAVVFLILTLIQFVVIARGSERVAEVGARFALDAMPGKQMAIDAELRSGALDADEARRRRRTLQRESQFYGAMDGAMKFVKGDAIAGIVITIINVVGGLVIGIAMRGMSAVESLQVYGLLTIGDGLVAQIPSLLVSTAAGLVVTRVASEDEASSLGGEIGRQIFGNPRALAIAAGFLLVLGIVPGLPSVPFVALGIGLGGLAFRLSRRGAPERPAEALEAAREREARAQRLPQVAPVSIELGPALGAALLDGRGGGPLLEQDVPRARDALFHALGVALPAVHARVSDALAPSRYSLLLQELPVASGEAPPGKVFVARPPAELAPLGIAGEAAKDPSSGAAGAWVEPGEALERAGLAAVAPGAYVARHLERAVRRRAHDLVGLQEVQSMLDQLERVSPALVRNVVPKPISLALLADVLRRLVEEGVSIRTLREILEALAMHGATEKDPIALADAVRASLRRHITHAHARGGVLSAYLVDPEIEETIRDAIQRTASGAYLALAPSAARDVLGAIRRATASAEGRAVLLTQSDVRRFLRRLVEVELPDLVVLGYQELDPSVTVQPLGRVEM